VKWSLLGDHQALQMGRVDHALINLHLSEGVVHLGGGELDTEGHQGVPEGLGVDLALHLEGLEGSEDDIVEGMIDAAHLKGLMVSK